jgi:hypothetical protein
MLADQGGGYGTNQDLTVRRSLADGTVVFKPGGSGIILPDGSRSMKFGWYRGAGLRGKLTIHGHNVHTTVLGERLALLLRSMTASSRSITTGPILRSSPWSLRLDLYLTGPDFRSPVVWEARSDANYKDNQ